MSESEPTGSKNEQLNLGRILYEEVDRTLISDPINVIAFDIPAGIILSSRRVKLEAVCRLSDGNLFKLEREEYFKANGEVLQLMLKLKSLSNDEASRKAKTHIKNRYITMTSVGIPIFYQTAPTHKRFTVSSQDVSIGRVASQDWIEYLVHGMNAGHLLPKDEALELINIDKKVEDDHAFESLAFGGLLRYQKYKMGRHFRGPSY